jgi:hypothetical protein
LRDYGLRLALLTISIAISLCIAEATLRALSPSRNVGPSFTSYDPVYGKRLKPGVSILRITPEFTMRLTTNSLGFRGPEPATFPAGAILFIGDSFTMGYGVDDGQEFPALVQKALTARRSSTPVVNTGLGANGNGRWVKLLRRDAVRFAPRAVVLQVQDNDFEDNPSEGLFTLSASGALVEEPIPDPGWTRGLQRLIENVPGLAYSHLIARFRQGFDPVMPLQAEAKTEPRSEPTVDPLTLRLIDESLAICADRHWPVIGVLADVREPKAAAVAALFAARAVPLLVVPGKPERPDLYYRIDGHWNAAGHQFAARLVLDELDALGLTKP